VIRDGFVGRGIDARTATLLAESSVTVLHVALNEWLDSDDDSQTLFEHILDALASLRAALALTDPGTGHPATDGGWPAGCQKCACSVWAQLSAVGWLEPGSGPSSFSSAHRLTGLPQSPVPENHTGQWRAHRDAPATVPTRA
jgi:hypothetical protein